MLNVFLWTIAILCGVIIVPFVLFIVLIMLMTILYVFTFIGSTVIVLISDVINSFQTWHTHRRFKKFLKNAQTKSWLKK